jgi:RNA polymerase-binding transcription factor DksA
MKKVVTKLVKKAASVKSKKAPAKASPAKNSAKKATPKKTTPKKVAKVAKVSKPVAKKVAAKKSAKPVVKPAAKKSAPTRSPNIVKPQLAKSAKKVAAKPVAARLQTTTKGNATTITVTTNEVAVAEVVVEERRLTMPPPPRPIKSGKKGPGLKPIKGPPAALNLGETVENWTATELKSMRSELAKELVRLKSELAIVEADMADLISAAGVGAGDDQADAGTKTFEREHEMSLVYNARDMVLQTEHALERIDSKSYGRCEECGNSIGKARLQVFPRATLCMVCKQKEERR